VSLSNSDRVYKNHYLKNLNQYIEDENDLEYFKEFIKEMIDNQYFFDPEDGYFLIAK
jgi:hypothetical protein